MFGIIGWVMALAGLSVADWKLWAILLAAAVAANVDLFQEF